MTPGALTPQHSTTQTPANDTAPQQSTSQSNATDTTTPAAEVNAPHSGDQTSVTAPAVQSTATSVQHNSIQLPAASDVAKQAVVQSKATERVVQQSPAQQEVTTQSQSTGAKPQQDVSQSKTTDLTGQHRATQSTDASAKRDIAISSITSPASK